MQGETGGRWVRWQERVTSWARRLAELPAPVAVLLISALLFARHYDGVLYPSLWGEEGAVLLARSLNDPSPATILLPYNGYVSLVPNLIAWIVAKLPIGVVPFLMAGSAFVISIAAYSLFVSRWFRSIVDDDRARRWIAVALAALPLGTPMIFSTLIYQLWHLLWIAVLLSAVPAPASRAGRITHLVVGALAICSHPLSIVVAPICAVNLIVYRSRHDRIKNLWFLAAVVAYLCLGIAPRAAATPLNVAVSYVPAFVTERVVFDTIFGRYLRFVGGAVWARVGAVCLLGMLACVLVRWRDRFSRRDWTLFAGAGAVILALSLGSAIGRPPHKYLMRYVRYAYVQQLVLVLVLGIVCRRVLVLSGRERIAAMGLALLFLARTNAANSYLFETRRDPHARQLALFLHEVEEQNHGQGPFHDRIAVLDRGRWSIRILPPEQRGH